MTVLVTGGAGYIGSHVVDALRTRGDDVAVVDDLSAGRAERIDGVDLLTLDISTAAAAPVLAEWMIDHGVDSVIHLAARKQVAESVARPLWYYAQNLGGVLTIAEAAAAAGAARIVFSSTAAVYGLSETPVTEEAPTQPANPYGETKLMGERILRDHAAAADARVIALRYFNVAGAARPELGDSAETNVVPMVLGRLARGERPLIFGDDYPTRDGTCVRDYIHVSDIADAHLVALDALTEAAPPFRVYNLGTGTGSTVLELVERLTRLAGSELTPMIQPRRPGDPAVVVADARRIAAELGWKPRSSLDDILASAWTVPRHTA